MLPHGQRVLPSEHAGTAPRLALSATTLGGRPPSPEGTRGLAQVRGWNNLSISGSSQRSVFAEPRPIRKILREGRVTRRMHSYKGDKFRPSPRLSA